MKNRTRKLRKKEKFLKNSGKSTILKKITWSRISKANHYWMKKLPG